MLLDGLYPFMARTGDIVVRASVMFVPEKSAPAMNQWCWAYHIRLENEGDTSVQLRTRHWEIIDGYGTRTIVDGDGVVGFQPVLHPTDSWDYVSQCPLATSSGQMGGHFRFLGQDGAMFDVTIPTMKLTDTVPAA